MHPGHQICERVLPLWWWRALASDHDTPDFKNKKCEHKGRLSILISLHDFICRDFNLSCKLEIFDEILFSPVKLINRLEKKHKRKLLFLLCVHLTWLLKDPSVEPLVSWSLWWRRCSSDAHPVSPTTTCCSCVSWGWDLLSCCWLSGAYLVTCCHATTLTRRKNTYLTVKHKF